MEKRKDGGILRENHEGNKRIPLVFSSDNYQCQRADTLKRGFINIPSLCFNTHTYLYTVSVCVCILFLALFHPPLNRLHLLLLGDSFDQARRKLFLSWTTASASICALYSLSHTWAQLLFPSPTSFSPLFFLWYFFTFFFLPYTFPFLYPSGPLTCQTGCVLCCVPLYLHAQTLTGQRERPYLSISFSCVLFHVLVFFLLLFPSWKISWNKRRHWIIETQKTTSVHVLDVYTQEKGRKEKNWRDDF